MNRFFKYTSLQWNYIHDILTNHQLYAAHISILNDPWEGFCNPQFYLMDDIEYMNTQDEYSCVRPDCDESMWIPEYFMCDRKANQCKTKDTCLEEVIETIRVCSMCRKIYEDEIPTNFLAWAHYGVGHSGVCFEVEVDPCSTFQKYPSIDLENEEEMDEFLEKMVRFTKHLQERKRYFSHDEVSGSGMSGNMIFDSLEDCCERMCGFAKDVLQPYRQELKYLYSLRNGRAKQISRNVRKSLDDYQIRNWRAVFSSRRNDFVTMRIVETFLSSSPAAKSKEIESFLSRVVESVGVDQFSVLLEDDVWKPLYLLLDLEVLDPSCAYLIKDVEYYHRAVIKEKMKDEGWLDYVFNSTSTMDDHKMRELMDIVFERLCVKHLCWSYESETRILTLDSFVPVQIKKVYCGVKMADGEFNVMKELCDKQNIELTRLTREDFVPK